MRTAAAMATISQVRQEDFLRDRCIFLMTNTQEAIKGGKNISQKQLARTPTPLGLIQVDIKSTKRIFHKICRQKKSLALIDGARETFCLCLCSISQRFFPSLLNNAQGY